MVEYLVTLSVSWLVLCMVMMTLVHLIQRRQDKRLIDQRVKTFVPTPYACAHCARQVFMPRPKIPLCSECMAVYRKFLEVHSDGSVHYQD